MEGKDGRDRIGGHLGSRETKLGVFDIGRVFAIGREACLSVDSYRNGGTVA